MNKSDKKHITIVGGGIAGSFLALLFADRGYSVDLYEQLSKSDICDTNSKRSYNITLYRYGIDMLKRANLWDDLKTSLIPLYQSATQLARDTEPVIAPIDHKKMQYYSLARSGLLTILLNKADKNPLIKTYYETTVVSIDRYAKTMLTKDNKTKKITQITCSVIFAADGVNSIIRPWLQQGRESSHSQDYAQWSYKQFLISKKWVEEMQLKSNTAYTWSRKNGCVTSFPNPDGALACMLVLPRGKEGFSSIQSHKDVKALFTKEFPNLLPLIDDISEQLFENPEGGFVTVHTDPWYYKDFIALVGDAAHGFYPFFGQGTSAAFGDSLQIVELVDTYGPDWEKIFPLYQEKRKANMDTLGEVSRIGFQKYLRNKRADRSTVYDQVEIMMHKVFPNLVNPPLYHQVITDPDNTAHHMSLHTQQRKKAKLVGMELLVSLLTGGIFVQEASTKIAKKILRKS